MLPKQNGCWCLSGIGYTIFNWIKCQCYCYNQRWPLESLRSILNWFETSSPVIYWRGSNWTGSFGCVKNRIVLLGWGNRTTQETINNQLKRTTIKETSGHFIAEQIAIRRFGKRWNYFMAALDKKKNQLDRSRSSERGRYYRYRIKMNIVLGSYTMLRMKRRLSYGNNYPERSWSREWRVYWPLNRPVGRFSMVP